MKTLILTLLITLSTLAINAQAGSQASELQTCITDAMNEAQNDPDSYELDYFEAKEYCVESGINEDVLDAVNDFDNSLGDTIQESPFIDSLDSHRAFDVVMDGVTGRIKHITLFLDYVTNDEVGNKITSIMVAERDCVTNEERFYDFYSKKEL